MGEAVYKQFRGRLTEAWHQLDADEQAALWEKVEVALTAVGGKRILMCDSQWASEQWEAFGVEEFPDIEAQQNTRHC